MGFWKTFFSGSEQSPEEERQEQETKNFDLLKYDGVRASKTGHLDYAVRCFQEALKLQDDLEVRDYLSQAFIGLGNLEEALAELQKLAEAEPDNIQVLLRQTQVAYMLEDYVRMTALCEQAMQLESDNPQVYFLNAQACHGQGNTVGAIAMLTKAIALKEDYAEAYLLRGQLLLGMGDAAGSGNDAEWLLKNAGAQEEVLLLAARVEKMKGNVDDAIRVYGLVTEVNPFCIEAFRERGQLKFDKGDKAGAEQDMQTVLELDPGLLADVNGEYSAEGIEQRVKQAYSAVNPLGL